MNLLNNSNKTDLQLICFLWTSHVSFLKYLRNRKHLFTIRYTRIIKLYTYRKLSNRSVSQIKAGSQYSQCKADGTRIYLFMVGN